MNYANYSKFTKAIARNELTIIKLASRVMLRGITGEKLNMRRLNAKVRRLQEEVAEMRMARLAIFYAAMKDPKTKVIWSVTDGR